MRAAAGFTLLELLVAVAIFALTGAMAYSGLQQVLNQQHTTEAAATRLADVQKAYRIMERDLEQLSPRGIRNEFGDRVGALIGGSGYAGVEFSRTGYANPAGFVRSDMQRVAYVSDQTTLLRRSWRVLDRAQDSKADEQTLIVGVERFEMRFLDQANEWQDSWPPQQATLAAAAPPAAGVGAAAGLPKAIEVSLELDDLGRLRWLFLVPDSANLAAQQNPTGGAAGDPDGGAGNADQAPPPDANDEAAQ